jgi:sodium transport system permease protein
MPDVSGCRLEFLQRPRGASVVCRETSLLFQNPNRYRAAVRDPDSTGHGGMRAALSQIGTLYRWELRGAFRERAIVVNSILIPIFLYPLIMWIAFSGLMFVQGHADRSVSRVEIRHLPAGHPALGLKFERDHRIERVPAHSTGADRLRAGQLDAVLEFLPAQADASDLPANFSARISFDGTRDRSAKARDRIADLLEEYRRDWIRREALARGVQSSEWQGFTLDTRNVASEKQMGGFVLSIILPVLFVVMVAMGCFYPAVDATGGERERNTWETLISSGASRVNIMTAKYLYVTTLGGMAGLLNVTALALTLKPIFAPLLEDAGAPMNFTVPLQAIPVIALAAVLLAGFVAAGMMIFAAFARTFKEGQAMVMPFYMLVLIPPMFLQTPGLEFNPALALVPIVNVTMMVRSAVAGVFPLAPIAITLLVSVGLIALCVRLAAYVIQFEDVMIGAYNGSFHRFIRQRLARFRTAASVSKGNS